MKSGEPQAGDVDVDLRRLFASLWVNRYRIAAIAVAMTAVVFTFAFTATPLYRAEARVVYAGPQAGETDGRAISDPEGIASQAEIISSSRILTQVARELNLAERAEFDAQPSLVDRMLQMIGLKGNISTIPPEERTLRENLTVYMVENSRVIVIQFSSQDPELAARIPNAIADAYVASQRAAKMQSNNDATEWLEPEIAELSERVKKAEARVADFRAQSDLLFGQNNTVLATQQLSELSSELSHARAARSVAEARAESVRTAIERGASLDTLPDVQDSELVQRLRERQVELKAQIADLSTTLLGGHPRIQALQSQLADLDAQIRAEALQVQQGLVNEAETARARESDLLAELNRLKAESARAESEQVELRALEREAAVQRELLETYLTNYREAAARGERNNLPVDARIFSRATVPSEPYFPKVLPITLAAFAASLLVTMIMVLLQELFSSRAIRPAEDGLEPAVPAEGPVATAKPASTIGVGAMSDPSTIRTKAQPSQAQDETATMPVQRAGSLGEVDIEVAAEALIATGVTRAIFVSPEGDEAAATSVLVAREVADAGLRVLLLDLTTSGAASRPMLESRSYAGITNLLAAEAQFSDVIHADLYSSCHIIPIGTADPNRAMRGKDRLPIVMNSLTIAYDVVVVECGPADAGGVQYLMGEDAQLLVSVLDPEEGSVAAVTAELSEEGFGKPLLVTPVGHMSPAAPPGRDAA